MSGPSRHLSVAIRLAVLAVIIGASAPAWAVPAFARKYKTSCETCHTVFPKLTPFGEAFRRNGFRFPGVDSDFVKDEPVTLGQDAYKQMFPGAVWPGTLPPSVPIAVGFNGSAVLHPQKSAGSYDGTRFNMGDLVGEAHVWGAGSLDDKITFFSELTFSAEGVEVEHATVQFNDLIGPQYLVNLTAGKGMATLSSFGPHSTYIADMAMLAAPVTGLYGAQSDSFTLVDNHNQVEVNGTAAGRFDYAVGLSAGTDLDVADSQDVHAHVGYKIGGMRLDGEHDMDTEEEQEHEHTVAEEHSVAFDAFAVRSVSHFADSLGATRTDTAVIVGGSARAQWGNLELDTGVYLQRDRHALTGGGKASALAQWNELSFMVYPWLVAAARLDVLHLSPSVGNAVTDIRIMPGVVALVRPNLKFTLTAPIEHASGAPDAGWGADEGFSSSGSGTELESIELGLFCAF